jgi:hypothetical protein
VQFVGRRAHALQLAVHGSQLSAVRLAKVPAGHAEALTQLLFVRYPTEQLRQMVCVVHMAHVLEEAVRTGVHAAAIVVEVGRGARGAVGGHKRARRTVHQTPVASKRRQIREGS